MNYIFSFINKFLLILTINVSKHKSNFDKNDSSSRYVINKFLNPVLDEIKSRVNTSKLCLTSLSILSFNMFIKLSE